MSVIQRIEWVDINRFILIFLVIAGHAASPYNPYIYLFHIPAFFFLSGYTANFKKNSMPGFIWDKFQSLMIPYFCINIIFFLIRFILHFTGLESIFYKDHMTSIQFWHGLLNIFKSAAAMDIGGATWFLIVLFILNIMAHLLFQSAEKLHLKDMTIFFFCVPIYIFCYFLHSKRIFYPYMMDLSLHALLYFILGKLFHKHKIFFLHINHAYAVPIAVFLIFFYGKIRWVPMNWPTREFDTPATNFLAAFAGIYLCYCVSVLLGKIRSVKKVLSYMGMKTLAILFFHFMGFRLFYLILFLTGYAPKHQVQELVLPMNNTVWLYATIFGIVFSLIADYVIRKNKILSYLLLGSRNLFQKTPPLIQTG